MDMCPAELEKPFVLNSNRCDTYQKVKAAIRDSVEQMRHKSGSIDVDDVSHPADEEHHNEWEEVFAAGNLKGKGKGKYRGKGKGSAQGTSKGQTGRQDVSECFPYKCHNCGDKGHKAAHSPKEQKR